MSVQDISVARRKLVMRDAPWRHLEQYVSTLIRGVKDENLLSRLKIKTCAASTAEASGWASYRLTKIWIAGKIEAFRTGQSARACGSHDCPCHHFREGFSSLRSEPLVGTSLVCWVETRCHISPMINWKSFLNFASR